VPRLEIKKNRLGLALIGSGFLLALFFLKHPRTDLENHQTSNSEKSNGAPPNYNDDLRKIVVQAKSPHISIEISQSEAQAQHATTPGTMDLKKFEEMTKKALKTLPKQEPRKDLTEEEAHHMSIKMLNELSPLGDIAQAIADHPEFKKTAFEFYYICAKDDQINIAWTVRSRCLSKLRALAPHLGPEAQSRADSAANNVNPTIRQWSDFTPN